jgi:hypothetical protein
MLGGRAIKALGQTTINLVENQAIGLRLRKIRSLLDHNAWKFNRLSVGDRAEIMDDLRELCQ